MQLVQACKAPWNWESARNVHEAKKQAENVRKKASSTDRSVCLTHSETQSEKANFPEIDISFGCIQKRIELQNGALFHGPTHIYFH